MAWIDGIHVCVLYPRLVRHFSCIYKTYEMGGNPSMTTCTLHHIHQLHEDSFVVCRSCEESLAQALVVCGLDGGHPRVWVTSQACKIFPCIQKICEKGDNPSITTCTLYYIPHLVGDGLVVCRYCKALTHSFGGLLPVWKVSMCM